MTLHGDQRIALQLLAGDEPRRVAAIARPADPSPLALAERVVREALMAPDDRAFRRHDRTGRSRQIAR